MGRSVFVWLVFILVETLHGIARGVFVAPYTGDLLSRQIGVVSGSILIFVTVLGLIKWLGITERAALLGVGIFWVVLTVVFEFALGYFAMGMPLNEIIAAFDSRLGSLMPFGLAFLALSPLIAARLRG